MAIAAIGSIGGAFQAASALLGFRADTAQPVPRRDATMAGQPHVVTEVVATEAEPDLLYAAFTPGSPCFEAVATALGEAGYLGA